MKVLSTISHTVIPLSMIYEIAIFVHFSGMPCLITQQFEEPLTSRAEDLDRQIGLVVHLTAS